MSKRENKPMGRTVPRKGIIAAVAAVVLVIIAVIVWAAVRGKKPDAEKPEGLLEELTSFQGVFRTVDQEEYDFFHALVQKNFPAASDEAELDQMTRDYINQMNAKFALGSYLGLCEPYSFALLEFRMEQENAIRAAKTANGEAVYGATQFTLESYFSYLETTLEEEIMNYLVEHADQPMLEQAEAYFDANPSIFTQLVSISYELEENGQTSSETLTSTGMRSLEASDGTLAEFLYTAQPGETLEDQLPDGSARKATLIDAVYEVPDFDDAVSTAVRSWLNAEIIDGLYESIAQNAPVSFAMDQ